MKGRLYIRDTKGKGRGVFCTRRIPAGEEFEICPLLILPAGDYRVVTACRLTDYVYNVDKEERLVGLSLGFGSLYNHATDANAAYYMDVALQRMIYYAVVDIPRGTEICINYGGKLGEEATEWFSS
ncbi:MAG TPA: SET domain-containing protein-lysine N-methyltransferase, partial [Puia sp.]|nr:SET domain-containing protein-lysine N-methyltransferase [Puia sp.]